MRGEQPYCQPHEFHGDAELDCFSWQVYTCYAEDGTPLYVGLSGDPATRLIWHARYSGSGDWYYHCARVVLSAPMRCKHDAHAFEIAEIQRLRPAFNKHHNPNPQPWTAPATRRMAYSELPPIEGPDRLPATA